MESLEEIFHFFSFFFPPTLHELPKNIKFIVYIISSLDDLKFPVLRYLAWMVSLDIFQ